MSGRITHTRKRIVLAGVMGLALVATTAWADLGGGPRAAKIRSYANAWLGTPYLWGGETRDGVDCSGYVRQMFRDLFNVELPRTTKDQINLGKDLPVTPSALEKVIQPGDLIFFVDREGIPSHVVAYAGGGKITHSEGGRGVVIDPLKYLWGRRIVARQVLFPGKGGGGSFGAIPAAGPIVPIEIPCPPSIVAKREEVARYAREPLDLKNLGGERSICEYRALANALKGRASPAGARNAEVLEVIANSLERMDAFQDSLGPRR